MIFAAFSLFLAGDFSSIFGIYIQPAMQSNKFFLENNIKRSFPILFRKKILFLFDLGNDAFHNFNVFRRNYLEILFLFFRNIT